MISFDADFILLNLALLLVFTAAGILVSQGRSYLRCTGVCVLAFTLIEGCRYMRGNDYSHYLDVYNFNLEPGQKLYTGFCNFLKFCGVSDYGSFFFYALVFSICLFVFLYRFKTNAFILFPLSLIAFQFFHEYMIRQELSYSFVFLYLNSLFDIRARFGLKKWKLRIAARGKDYVCIGKCVLYALMTISIHSANIFPIAVFTIFYVLRLKPFDWKIAFPILIFAAYVFPQLFDLSGLEPVLNVLAGNNEKLSGYADRFDFWFGDEAANDIYTRNPIVLIIEMLGHLSMMYLLYRISHNVGTSRAVNVFFNGYVAGAVIMNAFRNFEILNRMGYIFEMWWFLPLAVIIVNLNKAHLKKWEKFTAVFLLFFFYDYLKFLFMSPEMTLFLWDAEML